MITTLIKFYIFTNKGFSNFFVVILSMRSKQDPFQRFYVKSPGPFYLNINGCRLLCFKSNKNKLIAEEKRGSTPILGNLKQLNLFTTKWKFTINSCIEFKSSGGFKYELEKLLVHHKPLVEGSTYKGLFWDKLIPIWPENTEESMKET